MVHERSGGMGDAGGRGAWREEESVDGGTDVLSSSGAAAAAADHLVVMVHGILGRWCFSLDPSDGFFFLSIILVKLGLCAAVPFGFGRRQWFDRTDDWKFAAHQFVSMLPDKVVVHCSEKNMHSLTLDGVDVMGERLAKEVIEVIKSRSELRKISFIAHSVGGLVTRYAIGRLYRPSERKSQGDPQCDPYNDNHKGTIYGLEAMNFITVATPHLGSRGNKQVPFLFGLTAMEKVASLVIHWIFRRTGKHLFLTDNDDGKLPLLQRMVDDCNDLQFMSALQAFRRRVVYSNVGYDHIVGWRTSSIRRNSELPKWEDSLCETYPHIVYEEYSAGSRNDKCTPDDSLMIGDCDLLEEQLVTALSRLSWEKVDVSFHNSSLQRFAAHSVIQVKNPIMHIEGADVIQHMMDHFLI